MNLDAQTDDFLARQDAFEDAVEKIQENTQLTRQEAITAYENGQLAHVYEQEPTDFEECGDYER